MQTSNAEQERLEILRRYRSLIEVWHTRKNTKDRWEVRKAFRLAADFHKDKRRKSGEPYIMHPLEVAIIAAGEIGLGRTSIIAALLHDTVEDTQLELSDIEALFGEKVAKIIDGLTKISEIQDSNSTAQSATLRKIIMTLSDDVRVILIKLADRLHNMRTLDVMKPEQQLRSASETFFIYAPLAFRLGLYNIKTELEELSFKYTDPIIFNDIKNRLLQQKRERDIFIEQFVAPLREPLDKIYPNNEILLSVRSAYSIWQKVKENVILLDDFDNTFSIDIVIDNENYDEANACWQTYSEVSKIYKSDNNRLHDFITTPKVNGYKAIHASFLGPQGHWTEVHIKTRHMQDVAERGYAAFWEYNDLVDKDHNLNIWLNKTKDLSFVESSNAIQFLTEFKKEFLSKEIITFTPNGDTVSLPVGATVLDFAYAIHSDLGNHCLAGTINRDLKNPSYVLHPGDKVKILSSDAIEPTEEWFGFATTRLARSGIENFIRNKRKKSHKEGDAKLREICEQLKIEYSKQIIAKLIDYFSYNGKVDLYYFIASGAIDAKAIKEALSQDEVKKSWYKNIHIPFVPKSSSSDKESVLPIQSSVVEQIKSYKGDLSQLDYVVAKCCNPIPGDEVIGISVPGQPIQVHRTDCSTAHKLMSMYGKNIIKTKWKERENIVFLAGLHIEAEDKQGLVMDISTLLFERFQLGIRSFNVETFNGLADMKITFFISSEKKLVALKSSIKKLKPVKTVSRITNIDRI